MNLVVGFAVRVIESYQNFLAPFLPPACRFYPSCSQYAKEVLRMHGFFRGTQLAVWRLCRCQPFNDGGYDPPPRI